MTLLETVLVVSIVVAAGLYEFGRWWRRRKFVPPPSGDTVNDFQIFSGGGFAVPYACGYPVAPGVTGVSPVRMALPLFEAERGGLIWGGPLRLAFDWDWPEAPKVSDPEKHWHAWDMGNWSPEEWAEFERAVTRRDA